MRPWRDLTTAGARPGGPCGPPRPQAVDSSPGSKLGGHLGRPQEFVILLAGSWILRSSSCAN